MKSSKSGCSVGSPPVMQTPSRIPFRFLRKSNTSPVSYSASTVPGSSSLLWQNGQRKLQPPVKTVAATWPGKSNNVVFCNPQIFIFSLHSGDITFQSRKIPI